MYAVRIAEIALLLFAEPVKQTLLEKIKQIAGIDLKTHGKSRTA